MKGVDVIYKYEGHMMSDISKHLTLTMRQQIISEINPDIGIGDAERYSDDGYFWVYLNNQGILTKAHIPGFKQFRSIVVRLYQQSPSDSWRKIWRIVYTFQTQHHSSHLDPNEIDAQYAILFQSEETTKIVRPEKITSPEEITRSEEPTTAELLETIRKCTEMLIQRNLK